MVKKILAKAIQYPFGTEMRLKVLLSIFERTYISNRRDVPFTVRDLSEDLGYSKSSCSLALSWLEERQIIKKKQGVTYRYRINPKLKEWLVKDPKKASNPVLFKQIRKKYAKFSVEKQIKNTTDILRDLGYLPQGIDVISLRSALKKLSKIDGYNFDIIKDIKILVPYVENYTSWSSALIPKIIDEFSVFISTRKRRFKKSLRLKTKTFITHQLEVVRE